MNKRGRKVLKEGHLIETRFEKLRGNTISNANKLITEEIEWEGKTFRVYASDEEVKRWLLDLKERLGKPETFRHAALVPSEDSAYLFQIPKVEHVGRITATFRDWLDDLSAQSATAAEDQEEDSEDRESAE